MLLLFWKQDLAFCPGHLRPRSSNLHFLLLLGRQAHTTTQPVSSETGSRTLSLLGCIRSLVLLISFSHIAYGVSHEPRCLAIE
jgi:hypothetical protein